MTRERLFAAIVMIAALTGLIVQFIVSLQQNASYAVNLWMLLRYFTVITNIVVVVVFGRITLSVRGSPPAWLLGGTVLSIMLVGILYTLLLRGLFDLHGSAKFANLLLHDVTPILTTLYWLVVARKGVLNYRDLLRWAVFPFGYLIYALVRGAYDGVYAYPFINLPQIGWEQTLVNSVAIGAGFFVLGFAFVWSDNFLAHRGRSS